MTHDKILDESRRRARLSVPMVLDALAMLSGEALQVYIDPFIYARLERHNIIDFMGPQKTPKLLGVRVVVAGMPTRGSGVYETWLCSDEDLVRILTREREEAEPAQPDLDDPPAKPRTFWLVWCENQAGERVPTYQHWSQQAARSEAERLARLRPGERFWVLCAESACEVGQIEWVDADPEGEFPCDDIPYDDIPF